ncbi:MAG: HdeD family acid-resistance protein [Nitrososphaeraceae archaeon]
MSDSQVVTAPKWLRIVQITIGLAAIILSIFIIVSSKLGGITAISMVAITLLIVGIERIASGISSRYSKRSRLINIGLGAVIVLFGIFTLANPSGSISFMILLVGLALLINGIVRIIDALIKKKYEDNQANKIFRLIVGIISVAIAILTLASPGFGVILVALVVGIALLINGIEIIVAGIRGQSKRILGK